jgi:hypothetical protein
LDVLLVLFDVIPDEEFDMLGEDELALMTGNSRGCSRTG